MRQQISRTDRRWKGVVKELKHLVEHTAPKEAYEKLHKL
jgi:hypothetical protein